MEGEVSVICGNDGCWFDVRFYCRCMLKWYL